MTTYREQLLPEIAADKAVAAVLHKWITHSCDDVSVVIAACNERALTPTCKSIEDTAPNLHEIVVIDDASDEPVPAATRRNTWRNTYRLGCPTSRNHGCGIATGKTVLVVDAHMIFPPGLVGYVTALAEKVGGFAYAGCNGHHIAKLVMDCGILRCKWTQKPDDAVSGATAMMGACYAIPRQILDELGGWLPLPGYLGFDEEAMSILALKHRVPIVAATEWQTWHEFAGPDNPARPRPPFYMPYRSYQLNMVGYLRLLFEDETWFDLWRPRLADLTLDGVHVPVQEDILNAYETEPWQAYRRELLGRCTLDDAALFELLEIKV